MAKLHASGKTPPTASDMAARRTNELAPLARADAWVAVSSIRAIILRANGSKE
jgi:hypothetical protein